MEWEEARGNAKGFNEEMSGCFAEQKRFPDSGKRCGGGLADDIRKRPEANFFQ